MKGNKERNTISKKNIRKKLKSKQNYGTSTVCGTISCYALVVVAVFSLLGVNIYLSRDPSAGKSDGISRLLRNTILFQFKQWINTLKSHPQIRKTSMVVVPKAS